MFAKKLSKDGLFGSQHGKPGESYEQAEERLRIELTKPEYVQKYAEHIARVKMQNGFKAVK